MLPIATFGPSKLDALDRYTAAVPAEDEVSKKKVPPPDQVQAAPAVPPRAEDAAGGRPGSLLDYKG